MRKISFLFILLFFSLVPQVHADPSCEGRFVNPITDVLALHISFITRQRAGW